MSELEQLTSSRTVRVANLGLDRSCSREVLSKGSVMASFCLVSTVLFESSVAKRSEDVNSKSI